MSAAPYTILVIPGDGIGREVIPAAVAVLRATGLPFHFENADAGWECFQRQGEALPSATLTAARAARGDRNEFRSTLCRKRASCAIRWIQTMVNISEKY